MGIQFYLILQLLLLGFHPGTSVTSVSGFHRDHVEARPGILSTLPVQDMLIVNELCDDGIFTPSAKNCNLYYKCINGTNTPFNCENPRHWNQSLSACDLTTEKCQPMFKPSHFHTNAPSVPSNSDIKDPYGSTDFKLVCYYTNWSIYRKGAGRYTPENINANLCSHVIYGFSTLDPDTLTIEVFDEWIDIQSKHYERVTSLKAKGVKVLIALGGWNDSEGDKYSRLVENKAARALFVTNAVEFVKTHNFDGLDLDWEYPGCWQADCDEGGDYDRVGFSFLVKELKEAFTPHGYLLSAAVSPNKIVIDKGYDIATLSSNLDWISVMAYDYHGKWDGKTGHVSPLYYHSQAEIDYYNTNFTINYWINNGADRKKLVLGMPLYGQSFTLADSSINGLNAPIRGGGEPGKYTMQSGFLSYYEICLESQTDRWSTVEDASGALGPYAYSGNQWVSFDDVRMIARKSHLIRDLNIGGGMIWALDLDDFGNLCGQGSYPLLTTIKNVLVR